MLSEVKYVKIDDQGFHLEVGGEPTLLDVDNVIVCAGQIPLRSLHETLKEKGVEAHLIGGAFEAKELDAKFAIDQGTRLAAKM